MDTLTFDEHVGKNFIFMHNSTLVTSSYIEDEFFVHGLNDSIYHWFTAVKLGPRTFNDQLVVVERHFSLCITRNEERSKFSATSKVDTRTYTATGAWIWKMSFNVVVKEITTTGNMHTRTYACSCICCYLFCLDIRSRKPTVLVEMRSETLIFTEGFVYTNQNWCSLGVKCTLCNCVKAWVEKSSLIDCNIHG